MYNLIIESNNMFNGLLSGYYNYLTEEHMKTDILARILRAAEDNNNNLDDDEEAIDIQAFKDEVLPLIDNNVVSYQSKLADVINFTIGYDVIEYISFGKMSFEDIPFEQHDSVVEAMGQFGISQLQQEGV